MHVQYIGVKIEEIEHIIRWLNKENCEYCVNQSQIGLWMNYGRD